MGDEVSGDGSLDPWHAAKLRVRTAFSSHRNRTKKEPLRNSKERLNGSFP
jgi:hypothetical protein